MKLVIVGGGFTGARVARLARDQGGEVVATIRTEARTAKLRAMGVTPLVSGVLSAEVLDAHVDAKTRVLVTIPPDGTTDRAIAPLISQAASIAYVSSTGVYGDASGRVDESTPVDDRTSRAAARLDAERTWRDAGAAIVRAPAIYGPGRGMHLRLARGELRVEGGTNAISRVHVDDLAAALFALLVRDTRGALYVAGDLLPSPHIEVVKWICDALAIPMPQPAPAATTDETLRQNRHVDSSRIRKDLGLSLAYPTYREGYAHCLTEDRAPIGVALGRR